MQVKCEQVKIRGTWSASWKKMAARDNFSNIFLQKWRVWTQENTFEHYLCFKIFLKIWVTFFLCTHMVLLSGKLRRRRNMENCHVNIL